MVASLEAIARAAGVTRIARVTGLDRCGVEVACAVRPLGHVLQVSNGKGLRFSDASWGAVMEAAELAAAESPDAVPLLWTSARALAARAGPNRVWSAMELGSAAARVDDALWSDDGLLAFCEAEDLFGGPNVYVPAQAVLCPPAGSVDLGPIAVAWTTNGMGAHLRRQAALEHALWEAMERDQLARAAPEGWTPPLVMTRKLTPASVKARAPRTAALVTGLEKRGYDVALFDLCPDSAAPGALPVPVAGALLFERQDGGPVPMTAGYACRPSADDALHAALLEAAQSRLTDIHGAREDIVHAEAARAQLLRGLVASTAAIRDVRQMARSPRTGVPKALKSAGFDRAAAVWLRGPHPAVSVVKVVVPGFFLSELLL